MAEESHCPGCPHPLRGAKGVTVFLVVRQQVGTMPQWPSWSDGSQPGRYDDAGKEGTTRRVCQCRDIQLEGSSRLLYEGLSHATIAMVDRNARQVQQPLGNVVEV